MAAVRAGSRSQSRAGVRGPSRPSASNTDVYEMVTARIVEALEAGVVPWRQPWDAVLDGPRSLSTGKPYQGINTFILLWAAAAAGHAGSWWGTYKQIGERGGQVRRGEKGTAIVLWRFVERRASRGGVGAVSGGGEVESETVRIPFLRYFTVFNADQADWPEGSRGPVVESVVEREHAPVESARRIVDGYLGLGQPWAPDFSLGGSAYYSPSRDEVVVPRAGAFSEIGRYYGTLFHELGHSTGAAGRLSRPEVTDVTRFGSEPYAREELVAEMCAAFLCAEAGVEVPVEIPAGYLAGWLRALRGDSRLVVSAAGAAQKAANLIMGRMVATETETEVADDSE